MAGNIFSRVVFLLLCGLTAVSAPGLVHAQEAGQIRWRSDYNLARREAFEKKLPILIDFYMVPCFFCDKLDNNVFRDPQMAKLINERFIPLKLNGTPPNNEDLTRTLFVKVFPTMVLATHDGKILPPAIVGYLEKDALYDYLLKVLSSISDPDWMIQNQQLAQKYIQAKDYARAIAQLRFIVEDGKTRPIQLTARKLLQELEDMGQGRLNQAREYVKSRQHTEAIDIANETLRTFPGLQAARDAGGLLAELMSSPDVRNQERAKKAQGLLAQAHQAYKLKDYFICIDRCDSLVKGYGDLPEAQEAFLIHANIKNDPQFLLNAGKVLEERLGDVWLAQAENYLRTGQSERARFYFERVLRSFPGTRHASLAQIRLGQFAGINSRGMPTMAPQMQGQ